MSLTTPTYKHVDAEIVRKNLAAETTRKGPLKRKPRSKKKRPGKIAQNRG